MGVYDFIFIEKGVEMPKYDITSPYWKLSWQTRSFRDPMYRLHYISNDGYLYRADQPTDEQGFAENYGDCGSFTFIDSIQSDSYSGYPQDNSISLEWNRIRYLGDLRITAQTDESHTSYIFDFDRNDISDITPVGENSDETVYDKEDSPYTIVEITDKNASEYIVREEVKERGHTIYEERTVSDLNPHYPDDDTVVRIAPKGNENEEEIIPVPISRIAEYPYAANSRISNKE